MSAKIEGGCLKGWGDCATVDRSDEAFHVIKGSESDVDRPERRDPAPLVSASRQHDNPRIYIETAEMDISAPTDTSAYTSFCLTISLSYSSQRS